MANKENITLLSKYQMKVLYYKCTEGATHEEIAEILGRHVKTIQYHMTKIYKILEITEPGKSKEEMDSELKNEICPIIRQKFPTFDDIKIWAPSTQKIPDEEEEPAPPYQPPPSLERILKQAENKPLTPEIGEPPPPARPRIDRRRVIILIIIGLAIIAVGEIFSHNFTFVPRQIDTPTQSTLTQSLPQPETPIYQTSAPAITITLTPIPPATQTTAPTLSLSPTASPTPTATLFPRAVILSFHGRYVTALGEADGWVLRQEPALFDPCGWFTLIPQPDGRVALWTCKKRYVTAPETGTTRTDWLLRQEPKLGSCGMFTFQYLKNGEMALISCAGKYVTAGDGNWPGDLAWALVAETPNQLDWERFRLLPP